MGNWESLKFPEDRFEAAKEEIEKPELEGYEHFTNAKGMYDIYRRKRKESGLYEYKILGEDPDLDAVTATKVYRDLDYRKSWDTYVEELHTLDERDGAELVYWQVKYPFPLSNRDYVYARQTKEFDSATLGKISVTLSHPCPSTNEKARERSGVLRVDEFQQSFAISKRKDGEGSRIFMYYYDNPKGSIPTWLINYMAKTGIPGFVDTLKQTCKRYPKK